MITVTENKQAIINTKTRNETILRAKKQQQSRSFTKQQQSRSFTMVCGSSNRADHSLWHVRSSNRADNSQWPVAAATEQIIHYGL